jgi:hypothetical protein
MVRVFQEPAADGLGHAVQVSGGLACGKADVSAVPGLPKLDVGADVCGCGQAVGGYEGVVLCVEQQGGYGDAAEVGFGGGLGPIVGSVFEAVQRGGEDVVEFVEVLGGEESFFIEEARVLVPFGQGFGLHAAQEHAGVNEFVEALADGMAAGGQVERGTDGGDGVDGVCSSVPVFAGPAHEGVAAEGNTCSHEGGGLPGLELFQYPVDFGMIARVVGAGSEVELATAAPEMGYDELHASAGGPASEGLGVVAGRRSFEPVEQHQHGLGCWRRILGFEEVDVNEVAVGCGPPLTLKFGRRAWGGA